MFRFALVAAVACSIAACNTEPTRTDADVIIVGAGIAGVSAALEASAAGARVLVVEWSSVHGGHAVRAGGFAMVDTPLQRKKGHADSADLAYDELMAWGEDADPEWVRLFADRSRADVYDWLTNLGVEFNLLLATPEGSVPRFHFAGGPAINVMVPMLREALNRDNIRWVTNARVARLVYAGRGVIGVAARNERTGATQVFEAPAVVLATGGFQGNLEFVRDNWPDGIDAPERLLLGAGHNATGDGVRLGAALGAGNVRLDDQVIFVNGLPNPRAPMRGLHVTNSASIWVDARGERFVNETATTKITEAAALALSPQTFWMMFDSRGRKKLRIRDAGWLTPKTIAGEILDNPDVAGKADSIPELADATGLPADKLRETIGRYNGFVANGTDDDYQRFGAGGPAAPGELATPPYYALQLFPMTRKNLGGLAVDLQTRAIGGDGKPVDGLFAAGELTGVAGINGSHGGSGTFLAPSVLMGRIAGGAAAAYATLANTDPTGFATVTDRPESSPVTPSLDAAYVAALLERERKGYWHFEQSHGVVLERQYACDRCHTNDWPTGPAVTRQARLSQLESCTNCH